MEFIASLSDLREGDLMFGPIHGLAGLGVGIGQLALAVAEPVMVWERGVRKWFRIRHTGIVTKAATKSFDEGITYKVGTGPMLVQAMPGGAEEIELDHTHWTDEYAYIRPNYDQGTPFKVGLENRSQGFKAARAAQSFIDTPYDFETYAAIPLYRRGVHATRIKEIISGTDTMMCSRLVDASLAVAGWHLFDDNRLPGNVTPSEVFRRTLQLPVAARTTMKKFV